MEKIRILKKAALNKLISDIPLNLDRYRSGDFNYIENDPSLFFELDTHFDIQVAKSIYCSRDNLREVECCIDLGKAFNQITPYLARDERLWTYLTHTLMLQYSRDRWKIPDDENEAIKYIKNHFFVTGNRGIERDNAASRLWWMNHICAKIKNRPLEDTLIVFLHKSDVRAGIIERPSTSQNSVILSAIVDRLKTSYDSDKSLFLRERFRAFISQINAIGGTRLLDALDAKEISQIIDQCIAQTE